MTLTKRSRKVPGRPGNAPEAKAADPDGALEQHVAIVGRTGSGKSYAARGAVEALLEAGRQVVVLDPTGVWWGLRAGADGGPGFPVPVIGGDRANVALPAEAGAALAELFVARRQSAVVDTSSFTMGERPALLRRLPRRSPSRKPRSAAPRRRRGRRTRAAASPARPDDRAARDGPDRPSRSRAGLPGADDHPAAGGSAQGRPEPGRLPDRHAAHRRQDRAAIGAELRSSGCWWRMAGRRRCASGRPSPGSPPRAHLVDLCLPLEHQRRPRRRCRRHLVS